MSLIYKKPKILLVDDSSAIRAFFCNALSGLNFEIISSSNPLEASEILAKQEIDCILSDYEMPHMNGLEFCKEVKGNKKLKDIPFVILSMHESDEKIVQCLRNGADDYLLKRTNQEIILSKIKLMVEIHLARKDHLVQERLKTYQSTVATLNHEWNNITQILAYFIAKVNKEFWGAEERVLFDKLTQSLERCLALIKSFQSVESIEFEAYDQTGNASLVKLKKSTD